MKCPKPLSDKPKKAWTKLDVTVQAAIVAGFFTAGGIGIQAYSSYTSIKKELRTSCVKRLDEREDKLRSRAEAMLVALSKSFSYPYHPDPSHEELALRYENAIASAEALVAHSSPKLATKTMNLIGDYMQAMQLTDDEGTRAQRSADLARQIEDWHHVYFQELTEFDLERKDC